MSVEKLRTIVGRIDHQMLKPKSGKRGEGEIGTLLEISTTDYDFMSDIILTLADVLEASEAYEVMADKTIKGEVMPVGELLWTYKVLKDTTAAARTKIKKLKG